MMKSICGGCLAAMAPCEEEACLEMIDFGVMSPLLWMARSGSPLLEVTAWGVLAPITRAREARQLFVGAGGLGDIERVLVRKKKKRRSNRALLVCQEKAMQVLLRLCKDAEDEQDPEGLTANQQHHTTTTTTTTTTQRAREATLTASSLSAHDILSGKKQPDSSRRQEACHAKEKRDPDTSRGQPRQHQAAVAGEGGFVPNEAVYKCESGVSLLRGRLAEGFVSSKAVYKCKGGVPTPPSCRLAERFVSKEAVFRAVLRQMRVGTPASTVAAAEVFQRTWKACSRRQVDVTIPPILDLLKSGVWMLQSAAAQVILHVYVEDEQRLSCAVSGGVEALVNMVRTKAQQMQAGTLAALLSLCEHPAVPALVVEAGGLPVMTEYMTTARDVATRYVVLTLMKVILVTERSAVEPFLPDMVVTEHVLGASDEVEEFVKVFVEKRKATDYLAVGITNLRRFQPSDIASYKDDFKKLDKDASGELDEAELTQLLKQLKVDYRKKNVRRVIAAVDRNKNGIIEFDEFLDIMWNTKHVPGASRGALLKSVDLFTRGALASAQAKLKRHAGHFTVRTPGTIKLAGHVAPETMAAHHEPAGSLVDLSATSGVQQASASRTLSV
eukprot:jgi/Undpi1/2136/HiC_scaffold_12.g05522.m1